MNKRGFTLIELLTVIVLLAVISIISFVSINAVIEKNHVNDCMSLRESIKSATLDYFSDHRYDENLTLAGFNAGILVNAKYLSSPIYNPFDRSIEITPSDILIDITIDNRYNATSVDIVSPDLLVTCTKTASGSTGVADGLDVHQIDFNATVNGGRLNGTSPLYVKNGDSKFYTSSYATNQGTVPTATKSDLVFSGWYTKNKGGERVIRSNGAIVPSISGYTNNSGKWQLNSNKVLYAQFYPRTYTVNFYQGNGTSNAGSTLIGTQTCNFDQDCTLNTYASFNKVFPYSSNDTANAYSWHFAGWTENEKSTQVKYNESTNNKINPANYSATVNLYAIGYRDNYFYYYDTATSTAKRTIVKQYWNPYSTADAYRTEITIPAKHDMNSWTFKGYKLANSAATEAVANNLTYDVTKIGTKVKPELNNKGYYRSFYSRELSVKYNANGGSGTMNPTTITQYFNSGIGDTANNEPKISSNDITLLANGFNRAGYTFINWTENSATGDEYAAGSTYSKIGTNVTDTSVETTMYAKWTQNVVKITIKKDDSNWSNSDINIDLYQGNTVKYSSGNATKSGATFVWNGVAAGTYDVYASYSDGDIGKNMAKSTGTNITVSSVSTTATVNYYTVSKTTGANTTLVTRYETSSGTNWTADSHAFLNGVDIYIKATGATGYTPTLTVMGSVVTNTYTLTVSKSGSIVTSATAKTYTINYYQGNLSNGSTLIGSSQCTFASACTLSAYADIGGVFPYSSADHEANSSHDNYSWYFYGWSTSQTETTRAYSNSASINPDTYSATINLYALGAKSFHFNGGVVPLGRISSTTQIWNPYSTDAAYLTAINVPNTVAITGWEFMGYRGGSSKADGTITIAASNAGKSYKPGYNVYGTMRSVYKRTLTVNYDPNDGTGTMAASTMTQYYNSGYGNSNGNANNGSTLQTSSITLKANSFTKSGYAFSKWTEGSTSGSVYDAGANYANIGTDIENAKVTETMYAKWTDATPPTINDIGGGAALKATSQTVTLKCSDTVGVKAYYFGTTEPTAASSVSTTTSTDITALTGTNGLSKSVTAAGTYYLACKDAAGNFAKKSITIISYTVNNVLETIAGTTGTYKNTDYASASSNTYIVKSGTSLTLASIYTTPTGSNASNFKGYSTTFSTTAASPSTTAPTASATTYYMWFNRTTYSVTVSKPTNGSVTAETVTKTGNSVTASSAQATLTVKHGDTVKATATGSTGYQLKEWSGGYLSGSTNPATGSAVSAAKTITATFEAGTYKLTKVTNINILTNGGFENYTIKAGPTKTADGIKHSWDGTLNGVPGDTSNGYNVTGWGFGQNMNVAVPEIGYHAHMKIVNNNAVFVFKTNEDYAGKTGSDVSGGSVTPGTITAARWLGIAEEIPAASITAGKTYTITLDAYRVSGTNKITGGLYYATTSSGTTRTFGSGQMDLTPTKANTWETFSWTFTVTSDYSGSSKAPSLYVYGNKDGNGEFYVDNVRLEEVTTTNKAYNASFTSTELANLTRTGYTFGGWYNNGSYTTKLTTSSKLTSSNATFNGDNAYIYAKWTIDTPAVPTISGGDTKVYGYQDTTLTCATTSTYASGTDIYYQFGKSTKTDGTGITWIDSPSTTNTYTVSKTADLGTRYYYCRVYAGSDVITSSTVKSTTYATMTLKRVKVTFNATTNGGAISGTSPLYVYYGSSDMYDSATGSTTKSLPSASRTGYSFLGWYDASSGGNKVVNSTPALTGTAVSGWTNANKKWVITSTSDKTLYAQYVDNIPPTITVTPKIGTTNYTGWWTKDTVSTTVSFSDAGSGINAGTLQWKATGYNARDWGTVSPANTSTSSYSDTWSADRSGYGYYRIYDNAGNYSDVSFSINIDNTPPVITMTPEGTTQTQGTGLSVRCEDTTGGSGFKAVGSSFSYPSGDPVSYGDSGIAMTASVQMNTVGRYTASVVCLDNVGNSATLSRTYTVNLSYTEYTCTVSGEPAAGIDGFVNGGMYTTQSQCQSATSCSYTCIQYGFYAYNVGDQNKWGCPIYHCADLNTWTGDILADGTCVTSVYETHTSKTGNSCPTSDYTSSGMCSVGRAGQHRYVC